MSIQQEKFSLRHVQPNEHQWLVELHNDPLVLTNLTDPTPITFENHIIWWNNIIKEWPKEQRFIFSSDINGPIGFCKFYNIDHVNHNCVLGADIHISHRGKKYSYPMWETMINYCFESLKLHRISLYTAEYNKIAQRTYKNLGFLEEGRMYKSLFRNGAFYDQICMFMLKEGWEWSKKNNAYWESM